MHKESIMIIAGETSGDIHAAGLVRQLKERRPDLHFFGSGGDGMTEQRMETIYHIRDMSFLGFFEVLKHLPFVWRVFRSMIAILEERRPRLVILIDYPGFNLRFAKAAKKRGFHVLYYISPQVWAWGKKRIKKIARRVDRMLVFFPFEVDLYQKEGLDVRFVGHPLKDVVRVRQNKTSFFRELGLDPNRPTVGLLPGSREQEVQRLLPEMVKAVKRLQRTIPDLQAVVGLVPILADTVYTPFLKGGTSIRPVRNHTYDVMSHCDAVMVASGTATLETAILGTPMVILYRMSRISYLIGRALVRLKHIGLVNIVAGRDVVPELIQKDARGEKIAKAVSVFLSDDVKRTNVIKELKKVSDKLGGKGATERAAESVMEFIDVNTP